MIDPNKIYRAHGQGLKILERMAAKLKTGDVDSDELVDMGEAIDVFLEHKIIPHSDGDVYKWSN
jgi:hypothetical protein